MTVRLSPPLFCKITLELATSPETVPPMVAVTGFVVHETVTVTLAVMLLPVPALTAQVWIGLLGCV